MGAVQEPVTPVPKSERKTAEAVIAYEPPTVSYLKEEMDALEGLMAARSTMGNCKRTYR